MFKERENKQTKVSSPYAEWGYNHIHFRRYIVRYVRKSSLIAPLARRRKTKFPTV